ncbi:predicted nucleic acid-binding protein, contains PIN domain [Bellilinea caldifistulae]|uniref:PIN domain-containing protein n=1 Tax=Bellilinea caldifistulae TaxID=360411 RepID=A0A0P6WWE3_9CHLR|nr:type II toxin-antitoxin system VapC family toxin [Bellilinea caldifistulae]KPL74596.1 hypothetical protein AC812_12440 [Bellilinea caldifistulae]GAP11812.1 predicted nucleic acid-binding protein, contains PIN domain [Bellilinea caldifistulae]
MAVVIDANIALALFLHLPYTEQAYRLMDRLRERRSAVLSPVLWEYECLSGFHRAAQLGAIRPEDAREFMADLLALEIERVTPTVESHHAALRWAERMGQSKAYDAQYAALAEQYGTELWSADQRLVNTLQAQGAGWAHWIGEV